MHSISGDCVHVMDVKAPILIEEPDRGVLISVVGCWLAYAVTC